MVVPVCVCVCVYCQVVVGLLLMSFCSSSQVAVVFSSLYFPTQLLTEQ